jgi:hypothetical protein
MLLVAALKAYVIAHACNLPSLRHYCGRLLHHSRVFAVKMKSQQLAPHRLIIRCLHNNNEGSQSVWATG